MKLIRDSKSITELKEGSVVTIGNFDGVHRGHQALLSQLKVKSKKLNLPLVVLVFEPQPEEFFLREKAPLRLSSLREKLMYLKEAGVDYVYCVKFNSSLSMTSAHFFVENYLIKKLNCKFLMIGEDFRFGHQRKGDFSLLEVLSRDYTFSLSSFKDYTLDGERVSSTKVRNVIADDDLKLATHLLGRPYSMCGRVIKGDARGRKWGVPTANLALHRRSIAIKGVYSVRVVIQGQSFQGVANVGSRPTVDGSKNILEVHIFDMAKDIYGQFLQVFFLHKLRNEVRFNSIDELIEQIHKDVHEAKQYFKQECHSTNELIEYSHD